MKDLISYKGFKLVSLLQDKNSVWGSIEVDGLRYTGYLYQTCTCGIKDPVHGKHKQGCNTFMISSAKRVERVGDKSTDVQVISVRVIPHLKEDFGLHVKIGSILYDGLVYLDCTCGMYHYGSELGDHTNQECQKRKKILMQQENNYNYEVYLNTINQLRNAICALSGNNRRTAKAHVDKAIEMLGEIKIEQKSG